MLRVASQGQMMPSPKQAGGARRKRQRAIRDLLRKDLTLRTELGLSGRALAWHTQGPGFDSQHHKNKTKKIPFSKNSDRKVSVNGSRKTVLRNIKMTNR